MTRAPALVNGFFGRGLIKVETPRPGDKRRLLGPCPEDIPFGQMDWEMIPYSVTETPQELGIERRPASNCAVSS